MSEVLRAQSMDDLVDAARAAAVAELCAYFDSRGVMAAQALLDDARCRVVTALDTGVKIHPFGDVGRLTVQLYFMVRAGGRVGDVVAEVHGLYRQARRTEMLAQGWIA